MSRPSSPSRRGIRLAAAFAATAAIVGTLGWFWYDSLVPTTYSVMQMGILDTGGGPAPAQHGDGTSVEDLAGPRSGAPDVAVTLAARQEVFTLASGEQVDGYTLNGTSPGPTIRATEGDLIEVTLVNETVADGTTLHWHGVDVPNAEDGVAGVTQDAVPPGGEHVYRFRVDEPGSYWYHSHQVSHEQVKRGLFGALVIEPLEDAPERDVVAAVHTYDGLRTVSGNGGVQRIDAGAGEHVTVRVVNTDSGSLRVSVTGAPYRVDAIDARDINAPTEVTDMAVLLAAGGRADLAVTIPLDGSPVRIDFGAGAALVIRDDHQQHVRRGPPDAPARSPCRGAVAQWRARHRQPLVDRFARRTERRDVRGGVPCGQPRHLDGPLPQPATRC